MLASRRAIWCGLEGWLAGEPSLCILWLEITCSNETHTAVLTTRRTRAGSIPPERGLDTAAPAPSRAAFVWGVVTDRGRSVVSHR